MKSLVVIWCIVVAISGCSTLPKGYKLSRFSINNKQHNSLINARIPDYGDGHADGCIVMREMSLLINKMSENKYEGKLEDVVTQEPIIAAPIELYFTGDEKPFKLFSDSLGRFSFTREKDMVMITISSLAYRSLSINLKDFRSL